MSTEVLVEETLTGHFQQRVIAGKHQVLSDEPKAMGGGDTGLTPVSLLCAALGSCTSITLRMVADRKEWPLKQIRVWVEHSMEPVGGGGGTSALIDRFNRSIEMVGELDKSQLKSLLDIAERCPVHNTLSASATIVTTLIE